MRFRGEDEEELATITKEVCCKVSRMGFQGESRKKQTMVRSGQ